LKIRPVALVALVAASCVSATPPPAPDYSLVKSMPLGSPDRWDYVVYDSGSRRIYIAHGDRLAVVDARTGNLLGNVQGIPGGTHGTAISIPTHQGFTDDGRNGKVVAFDLDTLRVQREIPADVDADGIALDQLTGNIFVAEGDPAALTVIDPKSDMPLAKINAGEKPEYIVADGLGSIYVAGEANGDLIKIDAKSNRVVAHWPTPGCTSPHGLAVDARTDRAFMGCANAVMMVVDTNSGRVAAKLPIGLGNDSVAFDPVRKRVFSSNGRDGTISVYQQQSADDYLALTPIKTVVSARTMSVDPTTGWLFVPGADVEPATSPGGRPRIQQGTLKLMIFAPHA
jgi:DNA-binding beta-propeller fold protein YncE